MAYKKQQGRFLKENVQKKPAAPQKKPQKSPKNIAGTSASKTAIAIASDNNKQGVAPKISGKKFGVVPSINSRIISRL